MCKREWKVASNAIELLNMIMEYVQRTLKLC